MWDLFDWDKRKEDFAPEGIMNLPGCIPCTNSEKGCGQRCEVTLNNG